MTDQRNKSSRSSGSNWKGSELWDAFPPIPNEHLKAVEYGKRKYTTYDAQFVREYFTKLWGPYGVAWGLRNLRWGQIGAPDGKPDEITLEAEFYWPGGAWEYSDCMRWQSGGETRKKLHTSCLKKCLSMLGFAREIYYGAYDDDKYTPVMAPGHKTADELIAEIGRADNDTTVDALWKAARNRGLTSYNMDRVRKACDARKSELEMDARFDGDQT